MNFKEQSIKLIAVDSNKLFYLTPQAKNFLLNFEKPISIVSIAGAYRTGKSYLINKLLQIKEKGFKTGSTVQAVTKGLHIWGSPIIKKDKNENQICYLVIDSQGIGSCEEQVQYDLKIMMLIFIISSTVLYNSMGAIDQLSLDQLRVVNNLAKIFSKNQQERQKIKLIWVLRDFSLQLTDKNGIQITPNEYLEQCLEQVPSNNIEIKKKNEIRKSLKQNLRDKSCYTLVRPTMNEEELQNLSKCKLRSQFLSQIQLIRSQIFRGCKQDIKLIQGCEMTGKLLARLLEQCMDKLNHDNIPQVGVFWKTIKAINDEQQYDKLMNQFKENINLISLPIDKNKLTKNIQLLQTKYYDKLFELFKDQEALRYYLKQFMQSKQTIIKDLQKNNANLSKSKIMKQLRQFVKQNIDFENIDPCNLNVFKPIIERIQLKVNTQQQGFKYIISTMLDIMNLSEQRSKYIQEQLRQIKQIYQKQYVEKRHMDNNMLQLKKDYHDALKAINQSKLIQQSIDNQNMQLKHEKQCTNITLKNIQQQIQIKQSSFLRQIQQINFKNYRKTEQLSTTITKLRSENDQLNQQLQELRQQKIRQVINDRKQFIFEQKINQQWSKFNQQRQTLKKQITKLHRQIQISNSKTDSFKLQIEKEEKEKQKERNHFKMKEKQYVQQLRELKKLHAESKKTYTQTFNALKDSDKMNKNLQNIYSNNKTFGSKKHNSDFDQQRVKKYQHQIEKLKEQFEKKINMMNEDVNNYKQMAKRQAAKFEEQRMRYQNEKSQRKQLQNELMIANERFVEMSNQVQIAKERQRSLYEQSIVRLLSNLNAKQSKNQEYLHSYSYKR